MKIEFTLTKVKETRGTVVYGSDEDVPVRTVYVGKVHLPQPFPRNIVLTLEVEEGK